MINASELRLGNIFIDNKTNELLRVCKIDEADIGFAVIDRNKYPLPDGWQAEPIPLTPEWLKNLGFTMVDEDGFMMCARRGVVRIKINDRLGLPTVKIGDLHFTNIIHVHHLQNIYFGLTGKELTTNNEHLQSTS